MKKETVEDRRKERKRIGKLLRKWRLKMTMTQEYAALFYDVSIHTYSSWERGLRMPPDWVIESI